MPRSKSEHYNVTTAHIMSAPDIQLGRPVIVDTQVRVQDVLVWYEDLGMQPDDIADRCNLSLAQVFAALTFAYEHKDRIEAAIRHDRRMGHAPQVPPVRPTSTQPTLNGNGRHPASTSRSNGARRPGSV